MADDGSIPQIGERLIRSKTGDPVDFMDLWTGVSDDEVRTARWGGGYSGRPELAEALWPAIKLNLDGAARSTARSRLVYLRQFWRFLDAFETTFMERVSFETIGEVIAHVWTHPPAECSWKAEAEAVRTIGQLTRLAHQLRGTEESFFWPSVEAPPKVIKDIATDQQAWAALQILKREALAIFARWDRADRLASTGRNLLDCKRDWGGRYGFRPTEADIHATYRAFLKSTGNCLGTAESFYRACGCASRVKPKWLHLDFADLVAGLYPTTADLACLTQLFMARTGWNPSTVYSLDIRNPDWAVRLPGDMELYRIVSWKERSNAWQDTVCNGRVTTMPYQIVKTLMERNEPLRDHLLLHPELLSTGNIEEAKRSPWIAANVGRSYIGEVTTLPPDATSGVPMPWWRDKVRKYNQEATQFNLVASEANRAFAANNKVVGRNNDLLGHDDAERSLQQVGSATPLRPLIPEDMTPSDWRDIYATYNFANTRFSLLLTQWAMGHKHLKTTREYLKTRLWRRYSEKRLQQAQSAIFQQLSEGRLDFAELRAKLDMGVEPTDADRKRLAEYREKLKQEELTPAGYVCTTQLNPPPEMDPGNPSDGTMRARCGHRCAFCPMKGLAVEPHYLVKVLVSLRKARGTMSLVAWAESQYPEELRMIEHDLKQWPQSEIDKLIEQTEANFSDGRDRSQLGPGLN